MLLDALESRLVLVDYQTRLMDVPVWGTGQNPSKLGENVADIRVLCGQTLSKMHFSAIEEGLGEWLRPPAKPQQGSTARSLPKHLQKPAAAPDPRNTIVIAGCEAHVCLLQTALDCPTLPPNW